jgi:hypothetical protein
MPPIHPTEPTDAIAARFIENGLEVGANLAGRLLARAPFVVRSFK